MPDEYTIIDETIAPDVLQTIVEWVATRARGSNAGAGR
jgi:hypothetical protein